VTSTATDTTDSVVLNGGTQTPTGDVHRSQGHGGQLDGDRLPGSIEADGVACRPSPYPEGRQRGGPGRESVSLAAGSGSSVIHHPPGHHHGSGWPPSPSPTPPPKPSPYTANDTTDSVTLNGGSRPHGDVHRSQGHGGQLDGDALPGLGRGDGVASSTVTVTLKDDNGVALAGKSVTLGQGGGSSVITNLTDHDQRIGGGHLQPSPTPPPRP